jgi:ABC-type uncharacterized transport system substrate-binding protein
MQRREFIAFVGTIGAVWPRSLVAQPSDQLRRKVPRIGFLASVPHDRIEAFARALREQGYVEGQNIIIERRFWKDDPEQLAKFAAELVALDVEVIVAPTTPEALAAKAVTSTIPIVTATADAVGVGLAASHAQPGGNVTGLSARLAQLSSKIGLPTMVPLREYVETGFLVSYGPSYTEHCRQAATYIDQILKGAKPADLPVQLPTRLEMVFNLKTAKVLGFDVPWHLLQRADEVIE